jgi:V8-like Glu-specific endopeptidase
MHAMQLSRRTSRAAVSLLLAIMVVSTTSRAATTTAMPTAAAAIPPRAVGALFTRKSGGALGTHFCTATVVDSPSGNLVVTAAHCLSGRTGQSLAFVPEYHSGKAPLGVWTVQRTFVDTAWTKANDPDHDFAFLVVHRAGTRSTLQALTGAERLTSARSPGKRATVVGYPSSADTAISCTNWLLAFTATQLEFDCDGYTNGTSGSALVVDLDAASGLGTVVGVIGGYEEGGATPSVSYAATFQTAAQALYQEATG